MEPRIYTYKITFPNQGWWYWGLHKEEKHGETYDGSPKTHAEKWKNFEFEKQILEFFDDWDTARSVEKRLIDPDLNNPLCLNENSVGGFSLEALRKGGKIGGKNGSREDKVRAGKTGSREDKVRAGQIGGKIGGKIAVESGRIKTMATPESRSKGGKIGGRKNVESGQLESIRTPESRSKGAKTTNSQKWKCLVTGHVSSPGSLSNYQKARGIDTSLRERVKTEGVV